MKKALILFLAAAMLLPLFVSCSEKPKDPVNSGTSDTSSGTESATEDKGLASVDAVPALDFGGEAFNILQYTKNNWFYAEDQNGEQLNDIVYERNRALEERFHITIAEPNTVEWDDLITMVSTLVPAGDDQYAMISQSLRRAESTLSKGVLRDVLTLPYIDIDNPWYTQGLEDAIIAGKLLFLTGDYTLSYTAATVVMYFNKTKWIDYVHSTEDLYQTVRDGKWTLDRVMEYSADMYNDLNGNGARDEDDFYGFAADYIACVNGWIYGADMRRIEIVGDDYEIVQHMLDEPLVDLYTKLRYLMTTSPGAASFIYDKQNDGDNTLSFLSGGSLFASTCVGRMTTPEMVDMKDDFGVLPVPKWSEDQPAYYTNVDNGTADIIGVLKTVRDTEMVGAVIEAMSAMSYTYVMPVYCRSVLELRASRDQESSEMLRMIMDTRVMDWETLYAGYDGWVSTQRKFVDTFDCPEIVSGIVQRINTKQNYYDRIIELIWNMQ